MDKNWECYQIFVTAASQQDQPLEYVWIKPYWESVKGFCESIYLFPFSQLWNVCRDRGEMRHDYLGHNNTKNTLEAIDM